MQKNRRKNGFTLIELIVVISIIGILVLLATPKFIEHTQEAKLAQIKHDVKVVETVLDEYLIKNKSLPETLQEFDYSTALAEDRVYGKTGLITNLTGTYFDVTDMDEVKAINSKLKGKFIANDKGEAYYVSDDKIIGRDDNSSEEVASGQVKDVFAVISMIDNSPVLSGITIMEDGNVLELTPSIFSPEFLSSPSFNKTKIEELSGKNITNILSLDALSYMPDGDADMVYAISENGDVYVRGSNQYGELGLGHFNPSFAFTKNENLSNLKLDKISLGSDWAIGVKDGTVYGWGNNNNYQAVPYIFDFSDYSVMNIPKEINSPFEHINTYSLEPSTIELNGTWYPTGNRGFYFVSNDNVLYGVGDFILNDVLNYDFNDEIMDKLSQTPIKIGEFNEDVKEVFPAEDVAFVLTESGKLYGFGRNNYGQLGLGDTTNRDTPTEITYFAENDIIINKLYTDGISFFATTTDNKVYVWGSNGYGQLGLGSSAASIIYEPTELEFFRGKPVKDIKTSRNTTLVLTETGKVYSFGKNDAGQLGLYDTTNRYSPTEIDYFTTHNIQIKNIYTSGSTAFAITTDNYLYGWGANYVGQLGLGHEYSMYRPNKLLFSGFDGVPIKDIKLDLFSTFVLTESGNLYSFGLNTFGKLGLGDDESRDYPELVNVNGELVEKIDFRDDAVIVETKNHNFYRWGNWNYGEIKSPTKIDQMGSFSVTNWGIMLYFNVIPYSYLIDENNMLYYAYDLNFNPFIKDMSELNEYNVKSVFAGAGTSYITTYDNRVYKTNDETVPSGKPQSTQLYPVYYEEPALDGLEIKDIKGSSQGGDSRKFILTEDGNLYYFNEFLLDESSTSFDEALIHMGSDFDEIYGDSFKVLAKRGNDLFSVYTDFRTGDSFIEPIEFNIDVEMEKFSGNMYFGFILSTDGKLYFYLNEGFFDDEAYYQLRLTEIDMTSVENNGSNDEENDDVENSQSTVDKFATTEQSSYLLTNNNVYGFGSNMYGELGLGDEIDRYSPTLISSLQDKDIVKIVGGYGYAFAISKNGDVYAFGRNDSGELGLGDYTNVSTPVKNTMLSNFTSKDIKTGSSYSLLLEKGKLYAWGYNRSGRLGLGHEINMDSPTEVRFFSDNNIKIKNVYVGKMHNFVTTTDNKLYVWGSNLFGQLGLGNKTNQLTPTELIFFKNKPIKDIKTNDYSTFVLTENGELYSFGHNDDGQLGLGHYNDVNTPQPVNVGGKTVDKIITGESSIIAITTDGDIYGWGSNEYYELGGSSQYIATPERLSHIEDLNPINIKIGSSHTIIETQSGDIYGLGANYFGQLGLGHNNHPIETPTKLDLSLIQ